MNLIIFLEQEKKKSSKHTPLYSMSHNKFHPYPGALINLISTTLPRDFIDPPYRQPAQCLAHLFR